MVFIQDGKVGIVGRKLDVLSELCVLNQTVASKSMFDNPKDRAIIIYSLLRHKSSEEVDEIMEALKDVVLNFDKVAGEGEENGET